MLVVRCVTPEAGLPEHGYGNYLFSVRSCAGGLAAINDFGRSMMEKIVFEKARSIRRFAYGHMVIHDLPPSYDSYT